MNDFCLCDLRGLPIFCPWSKHDFECPSRFVLPMQLQVERCDVVRMGHVVGHGLASEAMGA